MSVQISLSLHTQHVLVIASVLIADNCGIPHGRLKISQRVLQRVHALHSADHSGEIFIRQYLKGVVQDFLYFGGAESFFG